MNQSVYRSIRLVKLLALLLYLSTANGQPPTTKSSIVSNIRVELDTIRVKVLYDLAAITSRDSVYMQAESRTRGQLNAVTVTGDVGTAVQPGKNKTIYWDYRLDGLTIDDAIRVTVLVKQPGQPEEQLAQQVTVGGGPANALLSVLAPGVGTIFVQPRRKVGLLPLITGAYVGLLVYGLVQRSQSKQQYNLYASQLNESNYAEANQLHHRYLVATWAAAALLVTDVAYTFLKGRKNEKQKQAARQRVVFNYIGTTPAVGLQLRF